MDKEPKESRLEDEVDEPEEAVRQHMDNIITQVGRNDNELVTRGKFVTCVNAHTGLYKGHQRSS